MGDTVGAESTRRRNARRLTNPRVGRLEVNGETLVVMSFDREVSSMPACLTAAEREVVALLVEGVTTREIARRRGSAESTVAKQLGAAYRKLGVGSRDELAAALREVE